MPPNSTDFRDDQILRRWVHPRYLRLDIINNIKESIIAKPTIKYHILDDFFIPEQLEKLIEFHATLEFSEEQDRRGQDGSWLPYDGAVNFAGPKHFGAEFFLSEAWHKYAIYLTGSVLTTPVSTEIKMRYHRQNADGFWIHTDSNVRSLVAIMYFNKLWKAADGGLLQLWQIEPNQPGTFKIDSPQGRLDCLTQHKRINTRSPGGGFPDGQSHDLVLIDQVVPVYNRLFLCDLLSNPVYHSVTPSNGRIRTGFVEWLGTKY